MIKYKVALTREERKELEEISTCGRHKTREVPFTIPFATEIESYLKKPIAPIYHDETTAGMYFHDSFLWQHWKGQLGLPQQRTIYWNK
jgi:hypothetical protein